jgi:hypothetical protein
MLDIIKNLVSFAAILAITGCVHTTGTSYKDQLGGLIAPTLSYEAFDRVEPVLKNLQPGQLLSTSGLKWEVSELKQGSQVVGLLSIADGWAGALSGNALGALSKLGDLYAINEGKVFGAHIYGYIAAPAVFIPRYQVKTVGTIITKEEFEQFKGNDTYAGYVLNDDKTGTKEKIYLKDVKVTQVTEIPLKNDVPQLNASPVSNDTIRATIQSLFTKEKFNKIEEKVKAIRPGTDVLGVLSELDGLITANYGGASFIFNIDGFLKYTSEHIMVKRSQTGISSVWPFGYVENGHEVPKLAMIFRNGVVEKVVPYSSKEEISAMLK